MSKLPDGLLELYQTHPIVHHCLSAAVWDRVEMTEALVACIVALVKSEQTYLEILSGYLDNYHRNYRIENARPWEQAQIGQLEEALKARRQQAQGG